MPLTLDAAAVMGEAARLTPQPSWWSPAPQDGALNPDGIDPGQCADLSNPPTSETPGNGAQ